MAKSAKSAPEIEITERMESKFVRDILERFENIESARGTFMNRARREREAMTVIYEGLAARGVPQKIAKLHIEVIRAEQKLKEKLADLDAEERKLALKLAKAGGLKEQLALFTDLPPAEKPAKTEKVEAAAKPKKSDGDGGKGETKTDQTANGKPPRGASGDDLTAAEAVGTA